MNEILIKIMRHRGPTRSTIYCVKKRIISVAKSYKTVEKNKLVIIITIKKRNGIPCSALIGGPQYHIWPGYKSDTIIREPNPKYYIIKRHQNRIPCQATVSCFQENVIVWIVWFTSADKSNFIIKE